MLCGELTGAPENELPAPVSLHMNLFARVSVPQTRHLGSAPQTAIGTGSADQPLFETSDPHTHASWRGAAVLCKLFAVMSALSAPNSKEGSRPFCYFSGCPWNAGHCLSDTGTRSLSGGGGKAGSGKAAVPRTGPGVLTPFPQEPQGLGGGSGSKPLGLVVLVEGSWRLSRPSSPHPRRHYSKEEACVSERPSQAERGVLLVQGV